MLKELFLLDPHIIFLNHGSFGACPRPVFQKYQAWQKLLEYQPVQFLGVELNGHLLAARIELGDYLNSRPENLVFIPNATFGVNIVARSLMLCPGDEILTTNHEYGACNYIWDFVCSKTEAKYKKQPITTPIFSTDQIIEELWQGVSSKTKIIFISHISSPTSIKMPVEEICHRARESGILTLIDGAHAPGQIPIDLDNISADFYVGNCHKWMMSPKGAGFLYVRPEMQNKIEPLIVSWGYQSKYNTPNESPFVDLLQWIGTMDPAAALSVPTAIQFMQEHQWEEVRIECHQILRYTLEMIGKTTGLSPLYALDSDFYRQMATFPIPKVKDLYELKRRLLSDFNIEIPCIEWEAQHYLRLSIQGYNSMEDVEQLSIALDDLLPAMVTN